MKDFESSNFDVTAILWIEYWVAIFLFFLFILSLEWTLSSFSWFTPLIEMLREFDARRDDEKKGGIELL